MDQLNCIAHWVWGLRSWAKQAIITVELSWALNFFYVKLKVISTPPKFPRQYSYPKVVYKNTTCFEKVTNLQKSRFYCGYCRLNRASADRVALGRWTNICMECFRTSSRCITAAVHSVDSSKALLIFFSSRQMIDFISIFKTLRWF